MMHRNALRLLKLVNTVLDFSRLESGRLAAHYQPTDLADYTARLASTFRSAIERAGLRLVVDCPPLPAPVLVDRDMWEKIVLNLVSNAVKFTFDGEIRVRVRAADGAARLEVSDTGVGIAPEELPHVFERFHRVPGVPLAHPRGHRHRAGAGPRAGRDARRHGRGAQPGRRGQHLHRHRPVRARAPARRPGGRRRPRRR